MFSLWSILGANLQEEDAASSEETNQFTRLLQEATNLDEILLHPKFNSFVESRAIQLDKFLRKEGIIDKLLELLISTNDKRIANAAAKVFTSKFAFVKSTLVNNEQLLHLLFNELIDFSPSLIQQNPENNSLIASTMSSLLVVHKWELVEYITSRISKDKINLILNYPNFLLAILDQDICTNTIKLAKWILEIGIVDLLINTFISGGEFCDEASEALIQLTSFESKIQESISKASIDLLVKATLSPSDKVDAKWLTSQVLSILANLVEAQQGGMMNDEDPLQPIVDNIPSFIKSLDDDPSPSLSFLNTTGVIEPFGMLRMKIVTLIGNLLRLEQRYIQEKLIESNILLVLLKLIIKYKWNNILHTKVVEIVESLLSSNLGFEINLLEQSSIHVHIAEVMMECHRTKLEKNEILPFTSIFEKLSSIVIQYADNSALDDLEESEIWRNYRKIVHGEDIKPQDPDLEKEEAGLSDKQNLDDMLPSDAVPGPVENDDNNDNNNRDIPIDPAGDIILVDVKEENKEEEKEEDKIMSDIPSGDQPQSVNNDDVISDVKNDEKVEEEIKENANDLSSPPS